MSALVLALALAATPVSHSKLGVVVLGEDATSRALLAACPALVVFPVPANPFVSAQLAAYRERCAGGIAVVRVGEPGLTVDASTVAALGPAWLRQLDGMSPDAVEGPPEPAGSPAALAEFWSAFADLVEKANLRPVVGALPADMPGVGVPRTDPFCPTADLMHPKPYTWWWSYHARSPMTADLASETTPTLGYRQIAADCGIEGVQVVVSEAGPITGPWQPSDEAWLAWLDASLQEDAGVLGAALSAAGTSGAASLAPVETELATRLANPSGER